MVNRQRRLKKQHERAVVADLLRWLSEYRHIEFKVIAEPDPPEAIIQSPQHTLWVEVVDAYWSEQWAKEQHLKGASAEKLVETEGGTDADTHPDAIFAKSFISSLAKKLRKKNYAAFASKYGPGILVVNIDYPLFSDRSLQKAKELWLDGQPWPNRGFFSEVFIRILGADKYSVAPLNWPL